MATMYCLKCGRAAPDIGPTILPDVRMVNCPAVVKNRKVVFGGCGIGLGVADPDRARGIIIERREIALFEAHSRGHANGPIPSKCWHCRKEASEKRVAARAVQSASS